MSRQSSKKANTHKWGRKKQDKKGQQSELYRGRRLFLMLLMLAGMMVLLVRAVYLEIFQQEFLQKQADKRQIREVTMPAYRGMILDRNGEPLAISSPVASIWADPQRLDESPEFIPALADALGMTTEDLEEKIEAHRKRNFLYLKRQISPEKAQIVLDVAAPGVHSEKEYRRFYPMGEAAAHVVGFTDIDSHGQEGIERIMNPILAGQEGQKRVIKDRIGRVVEDVERLKEMIPGQDVYLSLDKRIQYIAYRELKQQVEDVGAKAGAVVVYQPHTGEVLAIANMPRFNPHVRGNLKASSYRNRAVLDAFEPGSTMKPLTIAAALDSGAISANTMINTSPGYLEFNTYVIRDPINYGNMTLKRILMRSSNVGASRVALQIDPREHWRFLDRFGFGRSLNSGFPAEAKGKLRYYKDWARVDRASMGYGYGISVSLLQLARAYSVFATEGVLYPVSFFKQDRQAKGVPVLTAKTARTVRYLMEAVVSPKATGKHARVLGYRVAGKTGTAHKLVNEKYDDSLTVASFVGVAPVSNPQVVVAVMLDQPNNGASGGKVAAPVFARIMAASLRLLDIPPDGLSQTQEAI